MSNEYDGLIKSGATNEYDALIGKADEQVRARANIIGARSANPDTTARAIDLSRRTGVPVDTVERDVEAVAGPQKLNEYDGLLRKSAGLSKWLLDPVNARVAKDDYENLGLLERGWNEMKRQIYGTREGVQAIGAEIGARSLVELEKAREKQERGEYLTPWEKARLAQQDEVRSSGAGIVGEGIAGMKAARSASEALPMRPAMKAMQESKTWTEAWDAFKSDPMGLIFDFTAQSLPQMAVGVGATLAGGPAAGIAAGGLTSFGMEFVGGILDNLQAAGIDTNDTEALKVALSDPAVMREVYRKSAIKAAVIATVDAASFGMAGKTLAPAKLAAKPVPREATNIVAQALVQGAAGGGGEALGSLAIGEEIKPSAIFGEVLGGLGTMPAEVLTMRGAFNEAKGTLASVSSAATAEPYVAALESLIDLAGKSGLAQRSPEKLAEFMATLADKTESVYVSAQAAMTYFQSLPPDEAARQIDALGIGEQLAEATATGGDVVIPLAQYVAKIGPTPAHAAWRSDLRLDPAGMTAREAKEFASETDARIAELRKSVDEIAARVAEDKAQPVFDAVMEQAKAAGVTEEAARVYARLYAERYRARGQQLGIDPLEAFKRSGVRIEGALDDGSPVGRGFDQGTVDFAPGDGSKTATVGDTKIDYGVSRDGQTAEIILVETPKDKRGAGSARRALEAFLREADGRGLTVFLTPSPMDKGVSKSGLEKFYKSLGFKANKGKGKDFRSQAAMVREPRSYDQPAYHGSPFKFDKFTLDHIGEGEGAQAYGWGLYFAGNKAVAEYYRNMLAETQAIERFRVGSLELFRNGEAMDYSPRSSSGDEHARAILMERIFIDENDIREAFSLEGVEGVRSIVRQIVNDEIKHRGPQGAEGDQAPEYLPYLKRILASVERGDVRFDLGDKQGRLYTVDIPDDGAYLLWDRTLGEQPPGVMKAVNKALTALKRKGGAAAGIVAELRDSLKKGKRFGVKNLTGETLYLAIADAIHQTTGAENADREASLLLREAGVPGVKYLDGGSRTKGEGSYNYVLFDDALISIQEYEQPDGSGMRRGSISFGDGISLIRLYERRDLSTLLHESGHLWLEELRADALDQAANEQVRKDWQTVADWLGAKDGTLTRDQHEQFARGFEAYLMEGKAPSVELGDVFRRFKSWLIAIYRTMAGLDVKLSDEVREVMGRLVATEEAIAQASDELNARQLFGSADQAGMTDAEYSAYVRSVERARDKAETTLMAKAIEQVRRRRTEEWRDEEAKVRAEVEAVARQAPDLQAEYWLRNGFVGRDETPPEGPHRLDMRLVEEMVGKDVANRLPRGVPPLTVKTGGLHPDAAAERLGFASGRALIDALVAIGDRQIELKAADDRRSVLTSRVDPEVERIMAERHGDLLNDGSIAEEATAALHGEQRANVIAAEMRVLGRKTSKQPTPYSIVRKWAADTIAGRSVRDAATPAATQTYARQEARAAKAAERALIKGDFEEAFRRKQEQAINHALYFEAKKATEQVESARKTMQRYADAATLKGMDQDYLDQIHDLIERFDFAPASRRAVERRISLREWAEAQQAAGFDVAVPEELLDEARRQHFTEMTVEEVRGLSDSVKQIAHLGRMKKTLMDGKKKREFDAVVDEAVLQIAATPQRGSDLSDRGKSALGKMLGSLGETLRNADAALLKMETMFDWLDGGNPNGVFNRVVYRRLSEAQVAERDMQIRLNKELMALYGKLPKETLTKWREVLTVPDLPRNGEASRLTKAELIAIALNTGNEGNFDKLLRGEKWTAEGVKAALDRHLTAGEWSFVQGVWDLVDSLWPQVSEMERRLNGVAPPKIEPRPVETPHGTFRGGYYPLVYDPKISLDVEVRGQAGTDALFENLYTRATTPRGFTKKRTEGYARPLHLSLDVIPRHLTEVSHDLAYREAIMEADKFLTDKRIATAVEEALGREYYRQFRPWLQHIANEWAMDRRGLDGWEKFMRVARMNTTMVGMGFRLSTMLAQAGGYFNSAEIIGARWTASGLRTFVRNPAEARDFVYSRSGEMRHRANELERDIRDNMKKVAGETGTMADVRRFAFRGIALFDLGVTIPSWIGAYNKGLSEKMTDADAAAYADKVVRESQGAGGAKDLAAVQRNSETMKLFTMFYSYFNAFYNRQRQLARDVREAGVADVPDLLARSFWLLVAPALFGAYAGGQGPGEDEDWGAWAARKTFFNLFMGAPFARDVAGGAERLVSGEYSRGAQFMPVTQMAETLFLKIPKETVKLVSGEEQSEGFVKTLANAAGYAMRLPTGQIGNTAQFLYDVADGTQDPRGIKEWLDGLAYGPKRPK